MVKIRNTIGIKSLMDLKVVSAGIIEDKLGNQAVLNPDGTVMLPNVANNLSLTHAARLHYCVINNSDKNVDGWRYWYVYVDGEKVQLRKIKDLVHKIYVVDAIERLLAQI